MWRQQPCWIRTQFVASFKFDNLKKKLISQRGCDLRHWRFGFQLCHCKGPKMPRESIFLCGNSKYSRGRTCTSNSLSPERKKKKKSQQLPVPGDTENWSCTSLTNCSSRLSCSKYLPIFYLDIYSSTLDRSIRPHFFSIYGPVAFSYQWVSFYFLSSSNRSSFVYNFLMHSSLRAL